MRSPGASTCSPKQSRHGDAIAPDERVARHPAATTTPGGDAPGARIPSGARMRIRADAIVRQRSMTKDGKTRRRRSMRSGALRLVLLVLLMMPGVAHAEEFPSRPI